jgi:trans-aconitate 2-methyltransferase
MMSASREWNSAAYARLSDPQFGWGRVIVQSLRLRGDELVLDAGCGAGRVTAELLERLPRGRVLALDLSHNMVAEARRSLASRFGPHASYVQADLQAVPLANGVDGIFSTATFHWIKDHDALFASLFAALKPGGWLIAQCGGGPNLKRLRDRAEALMRSPEYAPYFADWNTPWRYPEPEETSARLKRSGFVDVKTWLEESPVRLPDAQTFYEFEQNVTLHRHLEAISDYAARHEFLNELTRQFTADNPPWTLDYWRLNIRGTKPA